MSLVSLLFGGTVEALLSHTPPSHEKCMGYEGLWEDRERLHARLAGISVPNVKGTIKPPEFDVC